MCFQFLHCEILVVRKKQWCIAPALHNSEQTPCAHLDSEGYEFCALLAFIFDAKSSTDALVETLVAQASALATRPVRHAGAPALGAAVPVGHRGGHHLPEV
jgi:hypothetical protein